MQQAKLVDGEAAALGELEPLQLRGHRLRRHAEHRGLLVHLDKHRMLRARRRIGSTG